MFLKKRFEPTNVSCLSAKIQSAKLSIKFFFIKPKEFPGFTALIIQVKSFGPVPDEVP